MGVPFIDIRRFEPGFMDEWLALVRHHTQNAQFIGGDSVVQLEKSLSLASGLHAVSCANGTDALQLALRAAGVSAGDTVLLPDLTFWATFEAVINVGATPCLIDCSLADQAINPELLQQALKTHRPKAVLLVHLYGWGATSLSTIRTMCQELSVPLIEDAAQAYGVNYQDDSIFRKAQIATVSFYPAKVLGAAGDGGAVLCADESMAHSVRQLSNHGRSSHYGYGAVGWNSRMDSLQAAFVHLSMNHVQARLTSRRHSAAYYRTQLSGLEGLRVVSPPADYQENGYCNVLLIDDINQKKALEAALKEAQIGFGNIYPSPMHAQEGGQPYLRDESLTFVGHNASWICAHVVNLPLFAYMRQEELDEVVSVVRRVFA